MKKKVPLKYRVFKSHLDDGERILEVAHRHFFVFLTDSYKVIFAGLIAPLFLFAVLPLPKLLVLMWFCFGLLGMAYHFIDWYFDAWLITNLGVIDIERHGLFERNSTRVDYHMMEGISYSINGFWPTVLGFGDITLDKLGTQTSIVLKQAWAPKRIERVLMKFQERYVRDRSIRDHSALKDMLSEMIAYHVQNDKINGPNLD